MSALFNLTMTSMATYLALFATMAPGSSSIINTPSASGGAPSGSYTTSEEVVALTNEVGEVFGNDIPGFAAPLVVISMVFGFAIIYRKKFRK
jgi:hypothetical protein